MAIGVHTSKISKVLPAPYKKRKTMLKAIEVDCKQLELGACQIFVQGPRNSRMSSMDYDAINTYCNEQKINLYVHSSYISVGIFSVTLDNKDTAKSKRAIKAILNQMIACDKLGSKGFVIHLSRRTPDEIVDTLKVLDPLVKKFNTPVLLEQPAKKPDGEKTYETPEKINNLTKMIIKGCPTLNWGWCLDTAHLFSAGIEMDVVKVMKKWLGDLKHPKYIKLFHLNGMGIDLFGTGKDAHEIVFGSDDDIWNADANIDDGYDIKRIKKSSIWTIAQFTKKNKIDLICEINRGNLDEVKFSIETLHKIF